MQDEQFPADLIILNSSSPKGMCYIETKNLDGETNLKHKQAVKELVDMSESPQEIVNNLTDSRVECDKPNEVIYSFHGEINVQE